MHQKFDSTSVQRKGRSLLKACWRGNFVLGNENRGTLCPLDHSPVYFFRVRSQA